MITVVKSTIRATTRSQMAIVSSAFSSDCANINARVALVSDRQSQRAQLYLRKTEKLVHWTKQFRIWLNDVRLNDLPKFH